MTLLRELIDIPEYVEKGSFVLRLSEGVKDPDATLRSYVVTEQLVRCFDDALNFIRGAVEGRTSKASYLHGSFGSGKSHFMAVLNLLLQGNTAARSIHELAPVISKHNAWMQGKKFLLVPYHMIGARNMEEGVLGGYADFVRRTHPEASIPGVYRAEGLFQDAAEFRERLGDVAFFQALNENAGGGGWGSLDAEWDGERFAAAVGAKPGAEDRARLVGALVRTFFKTYSIQAAHGEAYLSLDQGLSVISRHAKELGYDGVILFLDELILWLASHAADHSFVLQECQKVTKLVEAQNADRPVPLISFVARQRDLRDLIGDAVPGAERLNFADSLGWQEGRFHTITLEDRNLPAIAERRVLRCHDENARKELDAAFDQTAKIREQVMTILLTGDGDRNMFRKVYPFSPALVQTLIAVSSVLQRERTALKVMMQLLVDGRDTLQVGDLVPVGDLFDVVAHGDEAFSQEMALHFDNAKRLYHQKLLPALEQQHGRREMIEGLPLEDPRRAAFRNDDRLVKTLLLAALVPQVESLRGLTAEKLAALNHGTIRTPIPGKEASEALRRCKQWAASVGELRIGEEANPSISLQLSGVDTDTIIEQARREDNRGNQIRLVRSMLFNELSIAESPDMFFQHEFLWKNTRRRCELMFMNIRELPDTSLANDGEDWKLIIDWPFDEAGHGPRDDLSKLQTYRDNHSAGARTLCWVPAFFSELAMKDLGMLVILQHILSGERFTQYANHLSPTDRQSAKSLLENQRSVLQNRVRSHLEAAYGLEALESTSLDTVHDLEISERFVSLRPGFDPQTPKAGKLSSALSEFLGQALDHEYPGAPAFDAEVRLNSIKKVHEEVHRAAQADDGRILVEQSKRLLLRQIANPLLLGDMGYDATHFVLGQHWKNHFIRKASEAGGAITVGQLRLWIDVPRPMGLPKEAQNLVILVFAEQTSRSFFLHGGPFTASLTDLPDSCELREQKLPSAAYWERAVNLAGSVFGISASPLLNAVNVQKLELELASRAKDRIEAGQAYARVLSDRLKNFNIAPGDSERLRTAEATSALLSQLREASGGDIISAIASAEVATSGDAMGKCLSSAGALRGALETAGWDILSAIGNLTGARAAEADAVIQGVREALTCDEHVVSLAPRLIEAQAKATRLLVTPTAVVSAPEPEPVAAPMPTPPKPAPVRPGRSVVEQGSKENLNMSELKAVLSDLDARRRPGRDIRVSLQWVIEEEQKGQDS